MAGQTHDLTQGKELSLIVRLALPVCFENTLWMVLNSLVSMIIGRGVGADGLAAIGATTYPFYFFSWFSVGIAQCIAGITGMYFGHGEKKRLHEGVSTAVFLGGAIGLALSVLGLLLRDPLLRILSTPSGVYHEARRYLTMQYISLTGVTLHYVLSYMMIAFGDGVDPIIDICILGGSAVVVCFVLVHFTALGVISGSLSMCVGYVLACLFDLHALKRMGVFSRRPGDRLYSPSALREMLRKSLPFGLQLSISAIGGMLMQHALNLQGEAVVAAFTAATSVSLIPQGIQSAIGYVMNAFVSQNYGAGQLRRIRRGIGSALAIGACVWAGIACLQILGGRALLSLYVSRSDPQAQLVLTHAYRILLILTACSGGVQVLYIFRDSLVGLGHSSLAVFGMVAEILGRGFTAIIFPVLFTLPGVFFAEGGAWVLAGIAHSIVFALLYRHLTSRPAGSAAAPGSASAPPPHDF